MSLLNELPKHLTENRARIEAQFVFCLWKNPDLYDEYIDEVKPMQDLLDIDGIFYFVLGAGLYKQNVRTFDPASIDTYLSDKPQLAEQYEQRGDYDPIYEMTSLVSVENLESYYDQLVKSNALIALHKEGYDTVALMDKVREMTYEQLEDFMEYKLNNIFMKSTSTGMNIADLTSSYESWLQKWDSGVGVGYPIGFKMMNYQLAGIHRKNLILHLGSIGQGKTTSAINMYVLPVLEADESICVIANEQDEEQFRQMILSTVLFNRINYRNMNRQKFLFGGFTEEDKIHIQKAINWLAQYKNKLHYVHLTDYGTTNVKRIIKKYAKLGVGIFLVDTLKPTDESSDKSWAEFSETAKTLFQLAQKEDVAVIATAQLSSEAAKRKYLDLSCIGKSRAIAETAGQVIMFRPLRETEKEKLFVYTYQKINGKWSNIKKQIQLDKDKDYVVFFIAKNRYGAGDVQIVCERNMSFNYYKEIGYCNIEFDGFEKKK